MNDAKHFNNFKLLLEYFNSKHIFEFLNQYDNVLRGAIENTSDENSFKTLLDTFREESTPTAVIQLKFENLIHKSFEIEQIASLFDDSKKSSAIISLNINLLTMEDRKHKSIINSTISSVKKIGLIEIDYETDLQKSCDYDDLALHFIRIDTNLKSLVKILPEVEEFLYKDFEHEFKEEKLKNYVLNGKRIRSAPNFIGSPIHKLKESLKNLSDLRRKTAFEQISDKTGDSEVNHPADNIKFNSMFIALIAPSLTGKTQCAFAMEDLRSLYFALDQCSDKSIGTTQAIYTNYHCLNHFIKKMGERDLETIKRNLGENQKNLFESIDDTDEFSENEKIEDSELRAVSSDINTTTSNTNTAIDADINTDANTENIAAATDLSTKKIEKLCKQKFKYLKDIYAAISANKLSNNESFANIKYWTIGFLMKLVEEGNTLYKDESTNGETWMEFHAHRRDDRSKFYFSPMSISDARKRSHEFEKYFLFLDEFVGHPWAVIVRNLARAIGLSGIVANTNSDIGNLSGYEQAGSSGDDDKNEALSMIVTLLNEFYWVDPETIDSSNPLKINLTLESKLTRKIEVLMDKCPDEDTKKDLKVFFDCLKNVEFKRTRPGVVEMISLSILQFPLNQDFTMLSFLDYVFKFSGLKIYTRKKRIKSTGQGRLANLGLYLSDAFTIVPEEGYKTLVHKKSFLKNHLYYLLNPVDKDDWAFLTFHPREGSERLQIFKDDNFENWGCELTYFFSSEVLTILACMFIVSDHSVVDDIIEGEALGKRSNPSLINFVLNPLSVKFDGNRLEILAAVSIIDASHHAVDAKNSTLSGQDGISFIKNLMNNLIFSKDQERRKNKCEMAFHVPTPTNDNKKTRIVFDLEKFLNSCRIPFLYSANCKVPEILQKLSKTGVIKVGECSRTADKDEIDFKFDLFCSGNQKKHCAVGECKNWCTPIPFPVIMEAVEKALNTEGCRLNLIFCEEIKDHSLSSFKISPKAKVNVLKTTLGKGGVILWEPLIISSAAPDLVVLVFETLMLNNYKRQ